MKWQGRRQSDNVEDRRGQGGGMRFPPGIPIPGGGRMGGARGAGVGGGLGLIIIVVLALVFGVDPSQLLQGGGSFPEMTGQERSGPLSEADKASGAFVGVVLADTEDAWNGIFQAAGRRYEEPALVLFSDAIDFACGYAQSATGPFYCPADRKVYLDTSFFNEMASRLGASGDFAQAYVIAHEVGHHVQTLLGISQRVHQASRLQSEEQANRESVKLELQADCFAGVWANRTERAKQILEAGDIEEAMRAAAAVGDDRLQSRGRGYVVPESFTHGTSEQRARWFRRGLDTGDVNACDTFSATQL